MKYKINFFLIIMLVARVFAVGEAGAVFLLINPGSRAAGAGEAQVERRTHGGRDEAAAYCGHDDHGGKHLPEHHSPGTCCHCQQCIDLIVTYFEKVQCLIGTY